MILQDNMPFRSFSELRHLAEFTLGYPCVPVVAALNILTVLDAIRVLNAFLGRNQDANLIPLAGWFRSIYL